MSSFLYDVTKLLVFLSKQLLLQFLMKNYYFNTFSSPGLGLKLQKRVFKADDVTIPHLPLCDFKMLSILIENIVLEESQENISITSVFITLL